MTVPTPVTAIDADASEVEDRLGGPRVAVDDALLGRLRGCCDEVSTTDVDRNEAGRDWWPIAIRWATNGAVASRPGAVARPGTPEQAADVLKCCNDARVP